MSGWRGANLIRDRKGGENTVSEVYHGPVTNEIAKSCLIVDIKSMVELWTPWKKYSQS